MYRQKNTDSIDTAFPLYEDRGVYSCHILWYAVLLCSCFSESLRKQRIMVVSLYNRRCRCTGFCKYILSLYCRQNPNKKTPQKTNITKKLFESVKFQPTEIVETVTRFHSLNLQNPNRNISRLFTDATMDLKQWEFKTLDPGRTLVPDNEILR